MAGETAAIVLPLDIIRLASSPRLAAFGFAWRLGRDRRWRQAPPFDLTFSEGPMDQHHMDVCGDGRAVERSRLLRLASEGGAATKTAEATIDRMVTQAETFSQRAAAYPIRRATVQRMNASIHNCHEKLMRG